MPIARIASEPPHVGRALGQGGGNCGPSIHTWVPPRAAAMASASAAALEIEIRNRSDTGCAMETWATQPLPKNRAFALVGAVDELVDQHEGARQQLLLEQAARRTEDEIRSARPLEHVDIGPVVDVGRATAGITAVVAREKNHRQAGDVADAQRRRRLAPGTFDAGFTNVFEPRKIVNTGTADNAQYRLGHRTLAPPWHAADRQRRECPGQAPGMTTIGRMELVRYAPGLSPCGCSSTSRQSFFLVK